MNENNFGQTVKMIKLFESYGNAIDREVHALKQEWKNAKEVYPSGGCVRFRGVSYSRLKRFMLVEQIFLASPGEVIGMRWFFAVARSDWQKMTRERIALSLAFFERLKRLGITVNIPECPEEIKEESAS